MLVRDGVVVEVGPALDGGTVLDATGCVVAPGLVDLHTHLREPGDEEAETIATGARAGALGGFTAVVAMPNTTPPLDDAAVVGSVLAAGRTAACEIVSSGCITKGRAGHELAPMGELHQLGVRIFTDDGACVDDANVMRRAFDYARSLPGAVLAQHAEDTALAAGGSMHEGEWSSRLGIPGRAAAAEDGRSWRATCSSPSSPAGTCTSCTCRLRASVDLVRAAKARGVRVTAEATPHHFTPHRRRVARRSTRCSRCTRRCAPRPTSPRSRPGSPTAPSTRSPPTTRRTCPRPRRSRSSRRPRGCSGSRPRSRSRSPSWCSRACSRSPTPSPDCPGGPARIAGLDGHGGPVAPGRPANLCVLDPALAWEVDRTRLASRSRNTPFHGRKLTGRVRHTILRGEPVVIDGVAQR